MIPNPSKTPELLDKLAKSASWWRRFFQSNDDDEIHRIISELSPLDLAMLDQRTRGYSSYSYYKLHNWESLAPSDVIRLTQSKFATSLVGLASFHFSGYVREAATKELAMQHTGQELPFLLIRLNDWVSQVRDMAEKATAARFEPIYASHFLANISLVLRLQACGRVNKKFVDDICNLLKRPECKDVLQAGTASKDKAVRRTSFRLAAEADPSTRAAIIRAVMTDPDAVARSWAVRHFLPDVTPDELPGIVEPMLKDCFMPVRREALWFLATKRPDLASQPLRSALLDSHVSMRDTARHFLAVAGVKSARAFYIEAVQAGDDKQRPIAIRGIGETGEKTDVELIATHLNSNSTKTRLAAVHAIGKLDAGGQIEKLTSALSDTKPSVSREALKALLPKARYIPLNDLERLFASAADFHIRRNALGLIFYADKWKKIPALLKACADKEARLAEQAAQALRTWSRNYNGNFAEPTREDFIKISLALGQFEPYLPKGFATELRACLKIYFK